MLVRVNIKPIDFKLLNVYFRVNWVNLFSNVMIYTFIITVRPSFFNRIKNLNWPSPYNVKENPKTFSFSYNIQFFIINNVFPNSFNHRIIRQPCSNGYFFFISWIAVSYTHLTLPTIYS